MTGETANSIDETVILTALSLVSERSIEFNMRRRLKTGRVAPCEIATMTKLTTDLSHQPASFKDMTPEDKVTYRKWARGWFAAYSALIVVMVVLSIATRPERRTLEAGRTVGSATKVIVTDLAPAGFRAERRK